MKPSLTELDPRVLMSANPFPDWSGLVRTAQLYDGTGEVSTVGIGGGPRIRFPDKDFFAFEPSFRGGCTLAVDAECVYVGSGPGGGPVKIVYDYQGNELSREFVGNPESRDGYDVSVLGVTPAVQIFATPEDEANKLTTSAGSSTYYQLDLNTFDLRAAGPTKYGIGLVFTTPPAVGEYRGLIAGSVLGNLGSDGSFYVGTGANVGVAKSCQVYIEVIVHGQSASEIAKEVWSKIS